MKIKPAYDAIEEVKESGGENVSCKP